MYYFDNASTTKISKKNLEIYNNISNNFFFHPQNDKQTEKIYEDSQSWIINALALNDNYEVEYTSGGTEANNLAILGYAKTFEKPKHFITSKIEHSSVYNTFEELKKMGHSVSYVGVDKNGYIKINEIKSLINEKTVLISIMAVNNELGTIQDVEKIQDIIGERNIKVHVDAVQAVGKVKLIYNNFDLISISGHKLNAPKGVGALIKKKDINLVNIMYGGLSESKYRPGTQSLASQVTLAYSIKEKQENIDITMKSIKDKTEYMLEKLYNASNIELNSYDITGIININLKTKALSETITTLLKKDKIYVSTKSACSSKTNKPSRILSSLGMDIKKIDRSIRLSISCDTTKKEIDYVINQIVKISEEY